MIFYFTPVFKIHLFICAYLFTLNCRLLDKDGGRLAEEAEGEEEQDGGRDRAGRGTTGGAAGRRQSSAGRLRFLHLRFEERLPARSRESPSASHTSGQAVADSARWGEA
jgi:hypothetical protein